VIDAPDLIDFGEGLLQSEGHDNGLEVDHAPDIFEESILETPKETSLL
jgi:hypothetical protein